ncbi:hypothetical protein WJS89_10585 [Sphingomicrobium sp. XHP0235]|uniref:hypothetical protein n=1 Tax=Sphingomicrobium aquimarinum TaxID=3133971 RepID=UPI0031FEC636
MDPISAGIIGGTSLLSGIFGGKGAKKAADAQVKSGEMAIGEMRRQYDQTRSDMAPWREAGGQAIGSLSAMLQPGYDHTTSPGYQFRMDEGKRAIESSAAARGGLLSGGTLKGLERYAQGVAADDFNQQFNRTASVAAGGQQVGMGLGALGAQTSQSIGNTMMGMGNARASGYVGQANAMNGMFSNLGGLAMMLAK